MIHKDIKILLTGGSGFIGTNYINFLESIGITDIINIDIKPPKNYLHNKYWIECNILDKDKLIKEATRFLPQKVVHLAAATGTHLKKLNDFDTNIQGTSNIVQMCRAISSIERVIFTSSLLVCKMGYIPKHDTDYYPSTPYGQSKVELEKIVRAENNPPFCWTIVRPISVWGPWSIEPYKSFFKSVAGNWYFHIGDGNYHRSLGYVENLVFQIQSILNAPERAVKNKTFYLADNDPINLYTMANEMQNQLGSKRIKHISLPIVKIGSLVGDFIKLLGYNNFPLTSFRLNNILTEYVFDMSPIMSICRSLPYNFKEGIERTIKWLREHGEIK